RGLRRGWPAQVRPRRILLYSPVNSLRRGEVIAAPGHQFVPTVGCHEFGPAAVEVSHGLFARLHLGYVDHLARHPQSLIFVVAHRGAVALVVIVGVAAGDRAAAGGVRVVPILHVALLGHAAGAGIADVVVAQEFLDLARRIAIDIEPAPAFGLVRAAR